MLIKAKDSGSPVTSIACLIERNANKIRVPHFKLPLLLSDPYSINYAIYHRKKNRNSINDKSAHKAPPY